MDNYMQDMEAKIVEFGGYMLQGVFPTLDDPAPLSWVYSIGLDPELIVIGLSLDIGCTVLNRFRLGGQRRPTDSGGAVVARNRPVAAQGFHYRPAS